MDNYKKIYDVQKRAISVYNAEKIFKSSSEYVGILTTMNVNAQEELMNIIEETFNREDYIYGLHLNGNPYAPIFEGVLISKKPELINLAKLFIGNKYTNI